MDEYKAAFRAAKAARGAGKPSKGQLLKAENSDAMPPPPPRIGSQGSQPAAQKEAPTTYHPDSQATRVQEGGITAASILHSEPSVNKGATAIGPPATSLQASNALQTSVAAPETLHASTTTQLVDTRTQRDVHGGLVASVGQSRSMEGSTAELDDNTAEDGFEGGGCWNGGQTEQGIAASISSVIQQPWNTATSSQATATFHPISSESAGPIPAGFFDDRRHLSKGAQPSSVRANGGDTISKSAGNVDAVFAQFMQEVEEEAALPLGTEPGAALDEDEDFEKKSRDDFEQFVRQERLRELKEEAAMKRKSHPPSGLGQQKAASRGDPGDEEEPATALQLAGIGSSEVEAPKVVLKKRRRVAETATALASAEGSSDDEDPENPVDWRAKKSIS